MIFQNGGDVLLWITTQQRAVKEFSQGDDTQLKYNVKYGLLGNIKSAHVDISVLNENGVCQLQGIDHKN